jgi:hypothetical protein
MPSQAPTSKQVCVRAPADLEAGVCAGAYGVEDGNQVIPVLVELAIKGQICSFYGRLLM